MAGDAKKKAAERGHGSPWNTRHAARSAWYGDGSPADLMRKSENGFQGSGVAAIFLFYVFF